MLSILIQLNPGYLLGVTEKDPLVSHRRGSQGEQLRSPRQRVPRREAGGLGSCGYLGACLPGPGESRAGQCSIAVLTLLQTG